MTRLDWISLTRDEVSAAAPSAVAVLPVAATEQHGPHLPTVVDTALVTAIATRGCDRATASTVLAPTLPFGASDHHLPFGGTLSLAEAAFRIVVTDLLRSTARAGFTRALLLNGHGGNAAVCAEAAKNAPAGLTVVACSYWELAPAPTGIRGRYPGHAGEVETALMLAVAPELVRMDLARESPGASHRPPDGVADAETWRLLDGFTDDPGKATRELGERLLDELGDAVARAIERLA